jgi:hypothetical protein
MFSRNIICAARSVISPVLPLQIHGMQQTANDHAGTKHGYPSISTCLGLFRLFSCPPLLALGMAMAAIAIFGTPSLHGKLSRGSRSGPAPDGVPLGLVELWQDLRAKYTPMYGIGKKTRPSPSDRWFTFLDESTGLFFFYSARELDGVVRRIIPCRMQIVCTGDHRRKLFFPRYG